MNRISNHLVQDWRSRELSNFKRDELQDLLDLKAGKAALSYSTIDHLRSDIKQIFDMAVAEGTSCGIQPCFSLRRKKQDWRSDR